MGLECPYDFEGLGEDVNMAVAAADKDVVGTGADTVEIIALAMSTLGQTV